MRLVYPSAPLRRRCYVIGTRPVFLSSDAVQQSWTQVIIVVHTLVDTAEALVVLSGVIALSRGHREQIWEDMFPSAMMRLPTTAPSTWTSSLSGRLLRLDVSFKKKCSGMYHSWVSFHFIRSFVCSSAIDDRRHAGWGLWFVLWADLLGSHSFMLMRAAW